MGFTELGSGGFYKNQQYVLIDIKTAEVKKPFTLQNYQLMNTENTVLKDSFDKFYNWFGYCHVGSFIGKSSSENGARDSIIWRKHK